MNAVVKRNLVVVALFMVLIVAAFGAPLLSAAFAKEGKEGPTWQPYAYSQEYNDSFQYSNIMGMGHSTNETINMTHNGSLNTIMNITVYFHEPLIGQQGYLNVSLWENDTLLFTDQTSDNVVWVYNGTLLNENLTIVILSEGSDGTMTGSNVADYYVFELDATVLWQVKE